MDPKPQSAIEQTELRVSRLLALLAANVKRGVDPADLVVEIERILVEFPAAPHIKVSRIR